MNELKEAVYNHILFLLEGKINSAEQSVFDARESRDNETKSTAGDKHETGRAMSQIELDNSEMQLNKVRDLKNHFTQIDFQKERTTIEPGCLIATNNGMYLMSIGLGKIEVADAVIYAISIQSPIGQVLLHKKTGDRVRFQGKEIEIQEVS